MRFQEQVVVVTGGARGIGFTAAQLFAREGAQAINDLHADAVEAAGQQVRTTRPCRAFTSSAGA